ncbi:MAG: LPXTG cell wall anchor domain-containing protein [Opitutaceae bacterium]
MQLTTMGPESLTNAVNSVTAPAASTPNIWDKLLGTVSTVATAAAPAIINGFTKQDELETEVAYLKANGQAYPVTGKNAKAAASSYATPAPSTGIKPVVLYVIGGILVAVLVFALIFKRRKG